MRSSYRGQQAKQCFTYMKFIQLSISVFFTVPHQVSQDLDKGSSINDVTQFLIIFDTPSLHRHAFQYQGFSSVVTKPLRLPPSKAVTSFIGGPQI
jgi:hypothetical protein